MIPQEVIRKKRDNKSLSSDEIRSFVRGLTDSSFSDQQIAAMSMAIFLNDMNQDETINLTNEMTKSGDILNWKNIVDDNFVCDKHSTGGVGDKVSLILAPILAACGVYIPMISGRGLGHTGGTLDKFESIPGYNTQPDIETFYDVVKKVGCAIIGQTKNLAPADKKLYAVRDIVGAVESIPLITSSILSKKLASGINSLVLDIKVGNGSFNADYEQAIKLAKSLVLVSKGAGLKCSAVLTDMNQVLGWNAGHSLEIIESIKYLKNEKQNSRLKNITNELIAVLLKMTKKISQEKAICEIQDVIDNGKAAEKFEHMVAELGGPKDILSSFNIHLQKALYKEDILSPNDGFVKSIETRKLGMLLISLGGGRKKISDKIDFSIGFENVVDIGSKINSQDPLLTVHAATKEDVDIIRNEILKCFNIIADSKIESSTIYEIVD